jgi:hypothetical protein
MPSLIDLEQEIEATVQRITSLVYREVAQADLYEAQSLILARVTAKLFESLVIERQTEWVKRGFGPDHT